MIEQTIVKIGALLALGFGEAGSRTVSYWMAGTGAIDPTKDGDKIIGIFGFVDIRKFSETTDVLSEDIIVYVNQIAEIIHSIVDDYMGAANKNVGDSFLVVWRFELEDEFVWDEETNEVSLLDVRTVHVQADMSIISFLKILAKVKKSWVLHQYSKKQELLECIPNFTVQLGFALHLGWAIEGAIGSDFKIDAAYLSPNVEATASLEEITRQYGVPILFTG